MSRPFAFKFVWDGEMLIPSTQTTDRCKSELGAGEVITLERNEERSDISHNHYFACLHEAWQNLPDYFGTEYPTAQHLRSKALIRTGYCHERDIVCDTGRDAAIVAGIVAETNTYAIIDVRGNVIKVYTAKSQSRKSMGNKEFQESKDKVLAFVANLVNISPQQLKENA
jgi:hypothetical protein